MNVKLLRIDSRLLHGQVATSWIGTLGVQAVIVVNDEAAHSELTTTLLKQVQVGNAKTFVVDVAKAGRVYRNKKYADLDVFLVVSNPQDVVKLLDDDIDIPRVNVGGMAYRAGLTQVSKAVSVSPEDVAAFKEISAHGVTSTVQMLPGDSAPDILKLLSDKGLV